MKKYRMLVKLSSLSNSREDRELPLIQIFQRGLEYRTIGLEQLTETILEIADREEDRLERLSVSRLMRGLRSLFSGGLRRLLSRFTQRNILFRVEIWEGNEPDAPPIQDRRRRRRTTSNLEG